ncbi:MAG: hypothetical protein COV66_11375 [Nitrospinae bacterium CG11_big_fil_rev_8_21_14_0_20_45_15]|nr:MAG: hypothetical protein COV66_11375 [Nitrospinae bacterium CG11_big_fil_rev_8_21_14_0_20_45_15]
MPRAEAYSFSRIAQNRFKKILNFVLKIKFVKMENFEKQVVFSRENEFWKNTLILKYYYRMRRQLHFSITFEE